MVHDIRRKLPRLGGKKLYYMLEPQLRELKIGRDKLLNILRANNLQVTPLKNYKQTTNSKHLFRKHKNLIQDIIPQQPEQVWVADITYLCVKGKHWYLCLITDAYSKKIVGEYLSDSLDVSGCIKALRKAIKGKEYKHGSLIHHSDRGIQYCCKEYQKQLKKNKITCSMTESYDPYANAVAERVNGILKQEFLLESFDVNLKAMRTIVKQSVDIYNNLRPHWSCHSLTPQEMHQQDKLEVVKYQKKMPQRILTEAS